MDLVSFDTKGEFEMFAEIMKRGNYDCVIRSLHNATSLAIAIFSWLFPVLYSGPKLLLHSLYLVNSRETLA